MKTAFVSILTVILLVLVIAAPALGHHRNGHGKGKGSISEPSPSPTATATATAEPEPTPVVGPAPSAIDSTYFGNHVLGPLEQNLEGSGKPTVWPDWYPGTLRLWNTWGYNPAKNKYEGISWNNINTAYGQYDWTLFDKIIAKHKAQGTKDLIYTFGYTPPWAAGGSTTYDKPPTDYDYLRIYAQAVAQRAVALGMPIRNWEVWNEPNNGAGTWTGTHAQMVQMEAAIQAGVKAVDPNYKVLTPSPQGNATVWMDGYLAAGGGQYADVMAFHGYTFNTPETIRSLIANYKAVFAKYGHSGKPIWDTELMDLRTADKNLQARFLAVNYLLHLPLGVERMMWYAWDADLGRQWDHVNGANAAAVANRQVVQWMQGAELGALNINGSVYTLDLTRNGVPSRAVWNSAGSSSYSTTFTSYSTLTGATGAVNGAVTISQDPILLK